MSWVVEITGKDYHKTRSGRGNEPKPKIAGNVRENKFIYELELLRRDNGICFVTFGPCYQGPESDYAESDAEEASSRKNEAWEHVLARSRPTEPSETTRNYVEAVKRVESQARDVYGIPADHLEDDQFEWMMIKDGCFMLQLALFALGCSNQLGYPSDHPIFGRKLNKNLIEDYIMSMFFVGNQLPFVVLKELMKQSFFQRVLNRGKWKRPTNLQRMALFEFLVVPMFSGEGAARTLSEVSYRLLHLGRSPRLEEPCDILHGLWLLLIGPRKIIDDRDDDSDEDDECLTIRSATELRQAGILFKDNKGMGISGIKFKKNMVNAVLSLPSISVDLDTMTLFRRLCHYEHTQQLDRNGSSASAYLQLMQELIRSTDDTKLLATQAIIFGIPDAEDQLPGCLSALDFSSVKCGRNLRRVRLGLRRYSRPSMYGKLRNLLSLVLFLAALQTVYTVLSYYRGS